MALGTKGSGYQDHEPAQRFARIRAGQGQGRLHGIRQAKTCAEAEFAFDSFSESCGMKWVKAVARLVHDRDALPSFYDVLAEHWGCIQTANPVENRFATL